MKVVIACVLILCSVSACTTISEHEEIHRSPEDPLREQHEVNRSDAMEQEITRSTKIPKQDAQLKATHQKTLDKLRENSKSAANTKPISTNIKKSSQVNPLDYSLPIDQPKHSPQKDSGSEQAKSEVKEKTEHPKTNSSSPDKAKEKKENQPSNREKATEKQKKHANESLKNKPSDTDDSKDILHEQDSNTSTGPLKKLDATKKHSPGSLGGKHTKEKDQITSRKTGHTRLTHKKEDLQSGSAHHDSDHSGSDHYHKHGNVVIKAKKSVQWNIQRKIDR